MELHEIVMKLVGEIKPIGKTEVDSERYTNLVTLCELTNILVTYINDVHFYNKNSHEYSVKKAADYAGNFLTNTLGIKE